MCGEIGAPDRLRILIVEDDVDYRLNWIRGLEKDGVDIGCEDPSVLAKDVDAVHVFTYGKHEIHLVGNYNNTINAVCGHDYHYAFMDRYFEQGSSLSVRASTDDAVYILLTEAVSQPLIISISSRALDHILDIGEVYSGACEKDLPREWMIAGSKDYKGNREMLAKALGFRNGGAPVASIKPQRGKVFGT